MAWDGTKLAVLREKFADDDGGTMYDPHFREIASQIFGKLTDFLDRHLADA